MSYYRDRRDEPSRRLYVGNIDRYVRERDLERLFGKLGRTVDVEILSDFGFVEYDDIRDAEDAVREFDGYRLEGSRLRVEFAKNRRRGGPPSGGNGDGGYGSRPRRGDKAGGAGERCYNCGEFGHISRECSVPRGSGERAMRFEENRCFECGETGHRARDCPGRGAGRTRSRSPVGRGRSASPAAAAPRSPPRDYPRNNFSGDREDRGRYDEDEGYY